MQQQEGTGTMGSKKTRMTCDGVHTEAAMYCLFVNAAAQIPNMAGLSQLTSRK